MTFVLLGRDAATPATIRFWAAERIRLGKNKPGDPQLVEAEECARIMEAERGTSSPATAEIPHLILPQCGGERCTICGSQAHHKVGEEIFDNEPPQTIDGLTFKAPRHNLTAYLCCPCFRRVMGGTGTPWCLSPAGADPVGPGRGPEGTRDEEN